jgi:hypothetical protein
LPGYRTWVNGDVPSGTDFNNLFADPQQADVATDETRTSASYGDLATVGPSVTLNLVNNQKALVILASTNDTAIDQTHAYMSFAVSGATTLAATDANGAHYYSTKTGTGTFGTAFRITVFTATATGSHTFKCSYRSDGTGLMHWQDRRIIVKPL